MEAKSSFWRALGEKWGSWNALMGFKTAFKNITEERPNGSQSYTPPKSEWVRSPIHHPLMVKDFKPHSAKFEDWRFGWSNFEDLRL